MPKQFDPDTNNEQGDLHKLAELIADVRVAMLTTFPAGDAPAHARPMYTQKVEPDKFEGTLWFMTDAGSGKLEEIAENSNVVITYAAPDKNRYVVVYGKARFERNPDKAKELWNVHAKGWYPDGPTDRSLMLIEARVESAEYWDGPSNTSYLLKLLKAVTTGNRIDSYGNHGVVGK
jgi:general stress protein 26